MKTDGRQIQLGPGRALLKTGKSNEAQSGGDFGVVRRKLDGGLALELAVQINEHLVNVAIRLVFLRVVSETWHALRVEHVDLRTGLIVNQLRNTQQSTALRASSSLNCYKRIERRSLQ